MSGALVVDASVAVKWVFDEAGSDQARSLLRDTLKGNAEVFAPPLLASEVTNAIFQQQRRGRISASDGHRALAALFAIPFELVSPATLYRDALDLARHYGLRATYDAQYLALALLLDAEFWTADERLFTALSPSLPWVRLIAHYQVSGT